MTAKALREAEVAYSATVAKAEQLRIRRNFLIGQARAAGWSYGKIADALGLSRSRVAQLIAS